MTVKSLLIVCALTLSTIGIASAKSYSVNFTTPTKAGATNLKPGEYQIKVEGSQAVFTDEQQGKSFSVSVKIEQSDKKFDDTSVQTTNANGMDTIHEIDLGGSTFRLEFGQ
jgi:hypothetical protein